MGRSATLCGGKPPAIWADVVEHRRMLAQNLTKYVQGPACVGEMVEPPSEVGEYVACLADSFVSAIRLETESQSAQPPIYGVTISFGVIYAELWNQATRLCKGHPKTTQGELRPSDGATQLNVADLKAFAISDSNNNSQLSVEQVNAIELARLLGKGYQKVIAECRIAAKGSDATQIHHHLLILGDILQEMLDLHAKLAPTVGDA